jgi:hypothetical protein
LNVQEEEIKKEIEMRVQRLEEMKLKIIGEYEFQER